MTSTYSLLPLDLKNVEKNLKLAIEQHFGALYKKFEEQSHLYEEQQSKLKTLREEVALLRRYMGFSGPFASSDPTDPSPPPTIPSFSIVPSSFIPTPSAIIPFTLSSYPSYIPDETIMDWVKAQSVREALHHAPPLRIVPPSFDDDQKGGEEY